MKQTNIIILFLLLLIFISSCSNKMSTEKIVKETIVKTDNIEAQDATIKNEDNNKIEKKINTKSWCYEGKEFKFNNITWIASKIKTKEINGKLYSELCYGSYKKGNSVLGEIYISKAQNIYDLVYTDSNDKKVEEFTYFNGNQICIEKYKDGYKKMEYCDTFEK